MLSGTPFLFLSVTVLSILQDYFQFHFLTRFDLCLITYGQHFPQAEIIYFLEGELVCFLSGVWRVSFCKIFSVLQKAPRENKAVTATLADFCFRLFWQPFKMESQNFTEWWHLSGLVPLILWSQKWTAGLEREDTSLMLNKPTASITAQSLPLLTSPTDCSACCS